MSGKVIVSEKCSIATEHPLASRAGLEVMRAGGNAFDAAVAASFALSVVLPHLSGLGGDFFALFYESEGGMVRCLNGSGWAPTGLTIDSLRAQQISKMPVLGPRSVVIPGMVGSVEELQRRNGREEFSRLLSPSIGLAEHGFPISPGLAKAIARNRADLSEEALAALGATGLGPGQGEVLRQPRLAERLREIADGGSEEFYRGSSGEEMMSELEAGGVQVEREDMDFTPEWVEPLRMEYRGREVFEVPPNSMGAATLKILKEIERSASPDVDSVERILRVSEAARVAMAAKDELIGDPRFVTFDFEEFLSRGGDHRGPVLEGDTTYFAVADADGNLLSCIQSLFSHFGSGVYLKDSGFFLNNRASGFKLRGPNALAPRKRPVHTLSALLLSKSKGDVPYLAMGTSGGDHRPQLHALLVTNIVDYSMDIEAAIGFPRFLWYGKEIVVERGYKGNEGQVPGMRFVDYPSRTGVAQGIELTSKGKKACCDVRGDGAPAGL